MSGCGTVLVVAKAPVPGEAKTRLIPGLGAFGAADVAAAALLDTLDVAARTARALGGGVGVAFTGDLRRSARADQVAAALARCTVVPQRGVTFAQRLVHAHADTAATSPKAGGVVQIGMDTPQVSEALMLESAAGLARAQAVLGPADDGGWWVLALRHPRWAAALADVAMSTPQTGADTAAALRRAGATVTHGPALRDVDTVDDALAVARLIPGSRFAEALDQALAPSTTRSGVPA